MPALRRDQFPVTGLWTWLNHASYSPPPRVATEAVARFVTSLSLGQVPEGGWTNGLDSTREKAARLVGCDPDDVAFLKSAAEGIGVVALGLDWIPGDQVITYDQEFPAGAYPWLNLGHAGGRAVAGVVEPGPEPGDRELVPAQGRHVDGRPRALALPRRRGGDKSLRQR